MHRENWNNRSAQLANLLVAITFVLVPFYAFLSVFGSKLLGHFTLIRLFDEVLLLLLVMIVSIIVSQDKRLRKQLLNKLTVKLMLAYLLLFLMLAAVALARNEVSAKALLYSFVIDTRILVWFICVLVVSMKSSWLYDHWRQIILIPLSLVLVFGFLQFFVLPVNFLAHFGYGKDTYVAYTTINQNTITIRVASFLRGPNPLGAYLAAIVSVIAGTVYFTRKNWYSFLLLFGSLLVLFLTFSRSGWIGAFVGMIVAIILRARSSKLRKAYLAVIAIATVLGLGIVLADRHSLAVQNALLHVNRNSTAQQTSNQGHLKDTLSGIKAVVMNPLGEGPGTAGPASWYNSGHQIRDTENYFLQIGDELGWAELILFVAIIASVFRDLWQRQGYDLAIGMIAGLIGLLFVAQFSYAWDDDTLAYVWWGLAAIAIAKPIIESKITEQKTKKT